MLYNELLDNALIYYMEHGLVLYQREIVSVYRELKKTNHLYQDFPEVIAQNVCSRVHAAISNYDRNVESEGFRYPVTRDIRDYRSVTYDQSGTISIQNGKLRLGSIPRLIKMSGHQELGDIRTCTVMHDRTGKWYAYIVFRCRRNVTAPGTTSQAGLDMGLMNRAIFSDGTVQEMPYFDELEQKCDSIRAKRDRSDDPVFVEKCNRILSKTQVKINNKKNYELHRQTRQVVNRYSLIAVEDLDFKDIFEKQGCSYKRRRFQNALWSRYQRMLVYKSKETDYCKVVQVDPRYSSQ